MNPELNTLLQQTVMTVLLTIIPILITPLAYYVTNWVKTRIDLVEKEIKKAELEELEARGNITTSVLLLVGEAARTIVAALEQEQVKQSIERTKEEMKQEALKRVGEWISVIGMTGIPLQVYSDAIEAAIRQGAHNAYKGTTEVQEVVVTSK